MTVKRPKKKILQLIDGLNVGGAEVLLVDLVRGIKENGDDVCVGYSTRGPLEKRLAELNVTCTRLPRLGRIDPILFLGMCRLILRERPDIVHTHLFKSDLHGRLAARLCGVPVVVSTSHNNDVWARRFPLGRLYGFTAKLTDKVIAVSDEVREYQIQHTGVDSEKIIVIENGVDIQRFSNQTEAGIAIRAEFKIDTDTPLIGIIGRLQPQKDHDNFLNAAALINKTMPKARFLVVGDGPLREDLKTNAQALGLDSSVIFCGIRHDIPAILSALNLLVISSKWEGLPVTLLEGMAARCPIVSTAVGGVPNVVADGESALLVPPEDPSALANACLKILREAETARALVNAGFDRVKQQFSLDAMIQKILKLYQELLEKHVTHPSA
ncbi:MAG: GT4 family glycosyltransferase PelF [Chloroflexi bacterium]|nr:GT4 family glycosyltransferase PelF [Chloroflexota bacterium]